MERLQRNVAAVSVYDYAAVGETSRLEMQGHRFSVSVTTVCDLKLGARLQVANLDLHTITREMQGVHFQSAASKNLAFQAVQVRPLS